MHCVGFCPFDMNCVLNLHTTQTPGAVSEPTGQAPGIAAGDRQPPAARRTGPLDPPPAASHQPPATGAPAGPSALAGANP